MIYFFESLLTTFIMSFIFRGCWGNNKNWLKLEIEPPKANSACLYRWNTMCNSFSVCYSYFTVSLRKLRNILKCTIINFVTFYGFLINLKNYIFFNKLGYEGDLCQIDTDECALFRQTSGNKGKPFFWQLESIL
jgi:hypothetical protein